MISIKELKLDQLAPQTSRSTSLLTTLPSLSKIRHPTTQTWQSSTAKTLHFSRSELIDKVRSRNQQPLEITPFLVSQTLKKYFIPMFEAQRQKHMNLKSSYSRPYKSSKSLCESLQEELDKCNQTLKKLNEQLKTNQEDKNNKQKEIEAFKEKLLNHKTSFKCASINCERKKLVRTLTSEKEYMIPFEKANIKKEKLSNKLQIEKIRNSELKDKANELKHWNSLFNMQSDIMGERLKGLYFACTGLSQNSLEQSFREKFDKCGSAFYFLIGREKDLSHSLTKVTIMMHKELKMSQQLIYIRKELDEEVKKAKLTIKYKIESQINDIGKASEDKEKFQKKTTEYEKKTNDLQEEFEKTRTRVKEIKAKNKVYDELDEKVCRYCKKVFIEKENYNWSCKVHLSEWSNNTYYWCCGATKKDAPGCQTSKHISDEIDEDVPEEKGQKTVIHSKLKCICCKQLGHEAKDCFKDPNPKTSSRLYIKKKKTQKAKASYSILPRFKDLNYKDLQDINEFIDIESVRKEAVIEVESISSYDSDR
ncbi:hypothetical protein SteCoe_23075 [Stentor coeruleus]|uniref:Uncharacterized protein n=1 Tax=Stentor coeruleus TaxID=5963 RepID=A0A1R2BKN4_9CILI|nr:hypothetical protein SteCoe_23075 [Stentor coeruleus]